MMFEFAELEHRIEKAYRREELIAASKARALAKRLAWRYWKALPPLRIITLCVLGSASDGETSVP